MKRGTRDDERISTTFILGDYIDVFVGEGRKKTRFQVNWNGPYIFIKQVSKDLVEYKDSKGKLKTAKLKDIRAARRPRQQSELEVKYEDPVKILTRPRLEPRVQEPEEEAKGDLLNLDSMQKEKKRLAFVYRKKMHDYNALRDEFELED